MPDRTASDPGAPNPRLLDAHDIALAALREITDPETIGAAAGYLVESDGVISLRFDNTMPGYPGWFWTVSVAVVPGGEPTVLETELLPGDDALLAPEWVPWAVRLAGYQAQQDAAAGAEGASGDDEHVHAAGSGDGGARTPAGEEGVDDDEGLDDEEDIGGEEDSDADLDVDLDDVDDGYDTVDLDDDDLDDLDLDSADAESADVAAAGDDAAEAGR